jgi:hypothetical protein
MSGQSTATDGYCWLQQLLYNARENRWTRSGHPVVLMVIEQRSGCNAAKVAER